MWASLDLDTLLAILVMNEEDIPLYVQRGGPVMRDERVMDIRDGTFRWAPGNKSVWDQNDRYKTQKGYLSILTESIPTLCGCKTHKELEIEENEFAEGQVRSIVSAMFS